MSAEASWDTTDPASDADLATAAASGDRAAFAGIYDRYADRLHDFCIGMLRDRDAAADCVQDVFCTAATRLTQLREPDRLRPWLYAIARHEALRRLRDRRRETPADELPEAMSLDPEPDVMAARAELAELVAEAAGGLSDRDRAVLELAFRHGLNGPDLAEALDVSTSNAQTIAHRLRDTIQRSLGALLLSRQVRNRPDSCPELASILTDWDGRFTVLMRKRIARHIDSCPTCDDERRRLVSPAALLGATPVFVPAPAWLRDATLDDVVLTSHGSALADGHTSDRSDRRWVLPGALFMLALLASTGLTVGWLHVHQIPVTPVDITEPVPASAPAVAPPTPRSAPALPPPPSSVPRAVTPTKAPAVRTPPRVAPPVAPPPADTPPEAPPPDTPPPVIDPPPPVADPPPPAWPPLPPLDFPALPPFQPPAPQPPSRGGVTGPPGVSVPGAEVPPGVSTPRT